MPLMRRRDVLRSLSVGCGRLRRLTPFLVLLLLIYFFFVLLLFPIYATKSAVQELISEMKNEGRMATSRDEARTRSQAIGANEMRQHEEKGKEAFEFLFNSSQYPPAFVGEDVLGSEGVFTFRQRMTPPKTDGRRRRLILSWDVGHSQQNLGGCLDWDCEFTMDRSRAKQADVVLVSGSGKFVRRNPHQYVVFFSQESPKNTIATRVGGDYFNFSFGYRQGTPGASPYGYTVKLAPESRPTGELFNRTLLLGKKKAAAWFVSHCTTNSKREDLVNELQKLIPVDVFGACGKLECARGSECENALDTDYHFYIAFENSVCSDYITEKVWNQGLMREIVPVVLKRSIAENRLPPGSFIAVDDFKRVEDLAGHLKMLMNNKKEYFKYFEWRRRFRVVFLNGNLHDVLERPWGFCQMCRISWIHPRPSFVLRDFSSWWHGSCEEDGALVRSILSNSKRINSTA